VKLKHKKHFSFFSVRGLFVLPAILFVLHSDSSAQWTKISPGAFSGLLPSGGMLHFKNGILWGGYKSVSYSLDTGRTWTMSISSLPNIAEAVQDIDFFDKQNGVVRTNNYIYITNNGGSTWSQQPAPGGQGSRYTAYAGAPNIIISLASQGAYLSVDGGATWNLTYAGASPKIISYRSGGTMAIFENNRIVLSLNSGGGWIVRPSNNSLLDSYTFMWDPCDSNVLYLANEDYFQRNENWSEVFVTNDRGNTWASKNRQSWSYYNGGMSVNQDAAFFMTVANGINRTTDYGTTWTTIGGPNNYADTRWLVALTGNIIIGVDANGDVWRTDNSGGFGISTQSPVFSSPAPRTINACQRDSFQFIAGATHCHSYTITKATFSGPDTQLYSLHFPAYPDILSNGKRDSVHIAFNPKKQSGIYSDSLHVSWLDEGGNSYDTIFIIQETVGAAPISFLFDPPVIVFDTISPCHPGKDTSMTIRNISCDSMNINSLGSPLPAPFSFDTIHLPFRLPPDSSVTIKYHFNPAAPGFYTTSNPIIAGWNGSTVVQIIQLDGRETSAGFAGIGFDTLINFDTVSACYPLKDTLLSVRNLGCDTMRISSGTGNLGPGFSMDSVHYPIFIPPGKSATFHVHFHPPAIGGYSAAPTFAADWNGYTPATINFLLRGASSISKAGPIVGDTLVNFSTVSLCNPLKDTLVTLTNHACDTLRITSGPGAIDSNFSTDKITYPIILPPDSSLVIKFHFHPSALGVYSASVTYKTLREGKENSLILLLSGSSSRNASGPLIANTICTFDTLTTCAPKTDTLITLQNLGCDTLRIISGPGILGSGFSMDPVIYPIILPPYSSINIHIHFENPGIGAFLALAHFITARENNLDSTDLIFNGYITAGASTLSLNTSQLTFAPVSICSQDSSEIVYTNTGCDTLFVQPVGLSGDPDFIGSSSSELALTPGDTIRIKIYFLPKQKGLRNGSYTLRYRSRFSTPSDTLIPISGTVTKGTNLLTQSLSQINFGTTTLCAAPDSTIILHNSGCDTLTISGISWTGAGFISDAVFPIKLLPGEDTVIHIYAELDTSGRKTISSALLTIQSSSDAAPPPVALSRGYSYPKFYRLYLSSDRPKYGSGDTAQIHFLVDSLPNDLTQINAVLSVQNTDMMTYLSAQSVNTISVQQNLIQVTGNPITAPNGILADFNYRIFLTKDSIATLAISDASFNATDADYQKCIAYPSAIKTDSVLYSFACGEKLIQAGMNGTLAMQLLGIYPNPAQDKIDVDLILASAAEISASIIDVNGSQVLRQHEVCRSGKSTMTLNASQLPTGIYMVRITTGTGSLSAPIIIKK
jgi:photosystem II stability/assembly factor-like uncharacterized protein